MHERAEIKSCSRAPIPPRRRCRGRLAPLHRLPKHEEPPPVVVEARLTQAWEVLAGVRRSFHLMAHRVTSELGAHSRCFILPVGVRKRGTQAAIGLVAPGTGRPRMSSGNWVAREMDKLVVALANNTQLHGFRLQVPGYGEGRMAFILL